MKKKIISLLVVFSMLVTLCGCSLEAMSESITEYKENWFENLSAKTQDLSENWFENTKSKIESVKKYTFDDVKRETENLVSLDYEWKKVAYEDDLQSVLESDKYEKIAIQKGLDITENLIIPKGKTLAVQGGIIFSLLPNVSITIEEGASLIVDEYSYFVLNENSTCEISDGGNLTIAESGCVMTYAEGGIIPSENAKMDYRGVLQEGWTSYVYSDAGLNMAMFISQDESEINIMTDKLGGEDDFTLYDINKAVVINGLQTDGEDAYKTKLYGGFIITADGAEISGFEIITPEETPQIVPTIDYRGYQMGGGVTVVSSSATISNNTFNIGKTVKTGIEIYPYLSEDGTQEYVISDNTFVGFESIESASSAPVLVRENSTDVEWFGVEYFAGEISDIESFGKNIISQNNFEDCKVQLSVLNCENVETLKAVFVSSVELSKDFNFACDYYITGDWGVKNAQITLSDNVKVTLLSGVYFGIAESGGMTVPQTSQFVLQSGSTLETFGVVTGEISGSGKFVDWPNYIEISIFTKNETDANSDEDIEEWSEDSVQGQYIGYTVKKLKAVFYAEKQFGEFPEIIAYDVKFYLINQEESERYKQVVLEKSPLSEDYQFTAETNVFAVFKEVPLKITYDDNGGNSIGMNKAEWVYPSNMYFDNATTRKSDEFFAGWKIIGGSENGKYVSALSAEYMLELLESGYETLNLQAQWIEKNNFTGNSKAYYTNNATGVQFDENCEVAVYSPAGNESSVFDYEDYSYEDGKLGLVRLNSGTPFNQAGFVFFDVASGYQISEVLIYETPVFNESGEVMNGTVHNVTNEVLICLVEGKPFVWEGSKSFCVEVVTEKIKETEEIATIGMCVGGSLTPIAENKLSSYVFDCETSIDFTARGEKGEIITEFYVVATLKNAYGKSATITYYDPTNIEIPSSYDGGTVTFEAFAIDGRTSFVGDYEFRHWFLVVD